MVKCHPEGLFAGTETEYKNIQNCKKSYFFMHRGLMRWSGEEKKE